MRKNLVLFLALCLLTVGPTAVFTCERTIAAEEYATVHAQSSKVFELSLSDTTLPYESVTFAVEPHAVYQLSFAYALAHAEKGLVKVTGLTTQNAEASYALTKPMPLPATGGADIFETTSVTFTAEDIPASGAETKFVRIGFEGLPINKKASAETTFTVKEIKLWRVRNPLYIANGSAELLEAGVPVGTVGGTLITENAKDGKYMMQVQSGDAVSMQLGTMTTGEKVQLRGFAKAEGFTQSSSLTVSLYHNKAEEGRLISRKTFTTAGNAETTGLENGVWKYLRFSALPAPMGSLVATFSVEGSGAVYIDAVTLEEDANLLQNPHFLRAESAWRIYSGDTFYSIRQENAPCTLSSDGKCPDGQTYLQFGSTTTAITQNSIPLQENEKYLISFWYKAATDPEMMVWFDLADCENDETAYEQYNGTAWTVPTKAEASTWGAIRLGSTSGDWKQVAYVYTVPKGVIRGRLTFAAYNAAAMPAINMPSVQKVDEDSLGFYSHDIGDITVSADARPFVTLLGQPIETISGFTGEMHGVHVFPTEADDPQTLSEHAIIVAQYSVNADGTRTLVSVSMGDAASYTAPTWLEVAPKNSEGALRPAGTGSELEYVQYSEEAITVTDGDTVKEFKAFVWDSLSGLKPLAVAESVAD